MNTDIHPVTAALVDGIRYSWAAADQSNTAFSSWHNVSVEVGAISSALISLSINRLIGVDLLGEEYHEIQDDLMFLWEIAMKRAIGGSA